MKTYINPNTSSPKIYYNNNQFKIFIPGVTATVPTAPTNVVGTAGNAQVSLTWTAPTSNGGSAITDYVVQFSSDSGSTWNTFADAVSSATTATVTGLANGTAYVFRVAAVNAAGTSGYSTASASVTLAAVSPFSARSILAGNPNTASWSGDGTAASKLTPNRVFESASLTVGTAGTLRITGTANDGYDDYDHYIRKNGGANLIPDRGIITLNVSVSVTVGDVITLVSYPPDRVWGPGRTEGAASDVRIWIE